MNDIITQPERQEQLAFFSDCIHNGTERSDILAQARQKWPHILYKTLARRLSKAIEMHGRDKIMGFAERQVLLSAIARGEMEIETQELKYNPSKKEFEAITKREKANHRIRMAAIIELNRMSGNDDEQPDRVIVVEP